MDSSHKKYLKKIINFFNICDKNINLEIEKKIFDFINNKNKNLFILIFYLILLPFFLVTIFPFTIPYTWDDLFGIITISIGYIAFFSIFMYLLITFPIYTCTYINNKNHIDFNNININERIIYLLLIFFCTFIISYFISLKLIISLGIPIFITLIYILFLKTILKNFILRIFVFTIIFIFMFLSLPKFILKRYHITNYSATLKINSSNPICTGKIIKNKENNYCEINTTIIWNDGQQTIFKIKNKNKIEVHQLNNSDIIDKIFL